MTGSSIVACELAIPYLLSGDAVLQHVKLVHHAAKNGQVNSLHRESRIDKLIRNLTRDQILEQPVPGYWQIELKHPPHSSVGNGGIEGDSDNLPVTLALIAASGDHIDPHQSLRQSLKEYICTGPISQAGHITKVDGLELKIQAAIEQHRDLELSLKCEIRVLVIPEQNRGELEAIARRPSPTLRLEEDPNDGWRLASPDGNETLAIRFVDHIDDAASLIFEKETAFFTDKFRSWKRSRQRRKLGWIIACCAAVLALCLLLPSLLGADPRGGPISNYNWREGDHMITLLDPEQRAYRYTFDAPIRLVVSSGEDHPIVRVVLAANNNPKSVHSGLVMEFTEVGPPRVLFDPNQRGPYHNYDIPMFTDFMIDAPTTDHTNRLVMIAHNGRRRHSLIQVIENGLPAGKLWIEAEVTAAAFLEESDHLVIAGESDALSMSFLARRTDTRLGFVTSIPLNQTDDIQLDDPKRPSGTNWWHVLYPHGRHATDINIADVQQHGRSLVINMNDGSVQILSFAGKVTGQSDTSKDESVFKMIESRP